MASNSAAWLTNPKTKPLEIKPAPLWTPIDNEILIRNHAIAINPVDGRLQETAFMPIDYPWILGHDVAGEVVALGPNVTRFKPGTRVLGNAAGLAKKRNSDNGFQLYTILEVNLACEIPDDLSYEEAAVIPLGVATAAAGLFQDDFLKLQLPTEPKQQATGKTVLIWGGASSVGSNAIQLAVAAGYEVIVTASAKNFEYVKRLGVNEVFDYNSPTVQEDLVDAFRGKTSAGALDCIGGSAVGICLDVVDQSTGAKFVATTKPNFPSPPEGVGVKWIFATSIKDNFVGKAVFEDFLPKALKARTFVAAPDPFIVGEGLESVQEAVDVLNKGVSARKVVVSL